MPLSSVSRPAPTAGWVTNKNIGGMLPGEAIVMDNYFPRANTVDLINGHQPYTSGLGGPVETLAQWAGNAASQMIAAAGNQLWNVTNGVATSLGTGFGNNRWQTVNFGTPGGQFLVLANGTDAVRNYNGTTLSSPAITVTGFTSADFIHVNAFKGRLFFTIKNTLSVAYMPLNSVAGAASIFPLGQFAKRGGYLMAMGTWTRDGGSGMDDLAVFITSEGEVLVYQGTDPGNADDWSLIGVFEVGRPIGRRCFGKYRNDLAIITYDGLVPLSQVLSLDRQNIAAVAISSNINPTFTVSAQQFGGNFGWEMCTYAKQSMAIINVPIVLSSQSYQYVVNTDTGAWCRFTGHNAQSWCVFNNNLYFGGPDGVVRQADTGDTLSGQPITATFSCAFDYFGNTAVNKQIQQIRPTLLTSGNVNYQYGVDVDFRDSGFYGSAATASNGAITVWGSPWGSPWSASQGLSSRWLSGGKIGRCASFKFRTSTSAQRISVQSLDYAWQDMGIL